jgi:thioredoxin 1
MAGVRIHSLRLVLLLILCVISTSKGFSPLHHVSIIRKVPRGGAHSSAAVIIPESTSAFEAALKKAGPSTLLVVDFAASWCGPCRQIAQPFEKLANEYKPVVEPSNGVGSPSVMFLKADIDELREVAVRYNIQSVPTFVFLRDGKEVSRVSGADITKIRDTIKYFKK